MQRDGADEQKRDGAGAKIEKTSPLPPGEILGNKKYERSKYYFIAIFLLDMFKDLNNYLGEICAKWIG